MLGPQTMPKRSTSELAELAEMLARLLELARRLPAGWDRHCILKEILAFNARLARLEQTFVPKRPGGC
jgi:hypothetical protein